MAERTVEDSVWPVACTCGAGLTPRRVAGLPPQFVVWAQTAGDAAQVVHVLTADVAPPPAHDVYYMDARINPPGLYVIRAHEDEPAPPLEPQAAPNTITFGPGDYRINLTLGSPVTIIGASA